MNVRDLMTILPRHSNTPQRAKIAYANAVIEDLPVSQVRQLLGWMIDWADDYRDDAGEVNATLMAEGACRAFNLHDGDGNIPESLFELAGAIALADQEESR